MIDVRSRGALGDGRTDDTAALAAALRSAHDSGGATVFLPAGVYCVSAPLGEAGGLARVCLTGDGERASTIRATGNFAPITGLWSQARIENLVIDAGGHGSPGLVVELDKSYLRHCLIKGWTQFGIRLNPTTDGLLNWIDDNFVEQGNGYGIHTTHHFYDSWIVNNNVGSTGPNLSVESGPLRIIANHLNGTPTHNIELRGNKNITIVANICEGARHEAIVYTMPAWLDTDAPHVQIVGNNITNGGKGSPDACPAIGIYARDAAHRIRGFNITGNLFACEDDGAGWSHAVAAEHVDDLSISGNQWDDGGFATAAVLGGGRNLAVAGNTSANIGARVVATVAGPLTLASEPGTDYVYFLAAGSQPKMPPALNNTSRYTVKNVGAGDVTMAGITPTVTIEPGGVVDLVSDGVTWQSLR
ncbi:glycosyl hydrolase family 28-related protein [Mycobacterium sp. DL592]|uniref:glycosyl hydrolase family 28-related protein n=1 Tax=Mycobacterium sp. DL592 TaxID=2675524 RepID=UPI0014206DAC|nr:glycosyl hydrolase family 28-related protein [Mycobacterium sp. DL592]